MGGSPPLEKVSKMMESMKARRLAVVKNKGYFTKY